MPQLGGAQGQGVTVYEFQQIPAGGTTPAPVSPSNPFPIRDDTPVFFYTAADMGVNVVGTPYSTSQRFPASVADPAAFNLAGIPVLRIPNYSQIYIQAQYNVPVGVTIRIQLISNKTNGLILTNQYFYDLVGTGALVALQMAINLRTNQGLISVAAGAPVALGQLFPTMPAPGYRIGHIQTGAGSWGIPQFEVYLGM